MSRYLIVALIVIAILFAACGKKPQPVAQKFFAAIEKQDFEGAKQYATKDSEKLLDFIKAMYDKMKPEQKEEMDKKTFKVSNVTVQGDTAIVNYQEISSDDPGNPASKQLKMVKENGDWKVKLEKNSAK